jgi:hypothetical protein
MTTSFPTGLDALTNPTSANGLNSPDHAGQHANVNDAVEALEAKVGVDGSAVVTSLDYKITNINASNLASGTVPSARVSGAYTGVTSVGTLGSLTVTGDVTVDTNTLKVDSTNNRVGINVTSPTSNLDIVGNQVIRAAATQDGIQLAGRAGGTGSATVKLIPTTLTTNRTLTLPNVDGTAITTGNLSDITSVGTITSGTWSGSFGAVSGANLTSLNASNISSGTLANAQLPAAATTITSVGTLSSLTTSGNVTLSSSTNAVVFTTNTPDSALPYSQGPALQGQTGWSFYSAIAGAYLMGFRGNSAGSTRYMWVNGNSLFGSSPNDTLMSNTVNIIGTARVTSTFTSMDIFPDTNASRYCGGYNPAWGLVGSYNFYNPSDIRYKQNIEGLPLGVEFLRLINPIKFTYIYPQFEEGTDNVISTTEGVRLRAGLSAQNVKEALTILNAGDYNFWALGNKDDPESMQIIDYTGFIAPLIQAVKELDQRLQQLEII